MSWNNGKAKTDLLEHPEKVYATALGLLARREHSEGELRKKLKARGAEEQTMAEAIVRLRNYGYLDEARLAAECIRYHLNYKPCSRSYISHKLREKDVSDEYITAALEQYYDRELELTILNQLLAKELGAVIEDEDTLLRQKQRMRIARRLAARGFAPGDIFRGLNAEGE
ncbi:MAG: regulatory protein RecX [Clostridiales bacterium]